MRMVVTAVTAVEFGGELGGKRARGRCARELGLLLTACWILWILFCSRAGREGVDWNGGERRM